MKLELKVNSDEYFMSMILLVFGICCVLLLCFRLPFTQLYDHEKAKQLASNLPPQSILIIIKKKFLAIPYKSSCSSGILVHFTVSPCTILFSCLSLSPISCIGICLSTRFLDLIPWPFQCFDKYDRDYSTDDKTR